MLYHFYHLQSDKLLVDDTRKVFESKGLIRACVNGDFFLL